MSAPRSTRTPAGVVTIETLIVSGTAGGGAAAGSAATPAVAAGFGRDATSKPTAPTPATSSAQPIASGQDRRRPGRRRSTLVGRQHRRLCRDRRHRPERRRVVDVVVERRGDRRLVRRDVGRTGRRAERHQRVREVVHALDPIERILGQRAGHERVDLRRQIGDVRRQRRRRDGQVLHHHVARALGVERQPARDHVDRGSRRARRCRRGDRPAAAAALLGRHVARACPITIPVSVSSASRLVRAAWRCRSRAP